MAGVQVPSREIVADSLISAALLFVVIEVREEVNFCSEDYGGKEEGIRGRERKRELKEFESNSFIFVGKTRIG